MIVDSIGTHIGNINGEKCRINYINVSHLVHLYYVMEQGRAKKGLGEEELGKEGWDVVVVEFGLWQGRKDMVSQLMIGSGWGAYPQMLYNNSVKLLYDICEYSPPPIASSSTEPTIPPPSTYFDMQLRIVGVWDFLLLWWWTILDRWWWHITVADTKMVVSFNVLLPSDHRPTLDHEGDLHMPDGNSSLDQWIQRSSRGMKVDDTNLDYRGGGWRIAEIDPIVFWT